MALVNALPEGRTLVRGDFHTNNVFMMNGEPLLIDMDRVSRGHPIIELSDLYYFYKVLGEDDPSVVSNFMGFSYETANRFFDYFLRDYLGTDDEDRLREVTDKAMLLCCTRMIRKVRRSGATSAESRAIIDRCLQRIDELTKRLDTLEF
jgi:aminoglycoside phosphotransferase (APT) family kinase protein